MTAEAATAYEKRKVIVDIDAAEVEFDRHVALAAFKEALAPGKVLSKETMERIRRGGHIDLARCCMAYLLNVENASDQPDLPGHRAFLACVRRIRDAARDMASAGDTLVEQMIRHEGETGSSEVIREEALRRLGAALHGRFYIYDFESTFLELLRPKRIDNPLGGNKGTHGLTDCVAVYDEADAIINEYRKRTNAAKPSGDAHRGMRAGNRSDRDRQAFIRDLADIYENVMDVEPKAPNDDGKRSPFVRFVTYVFDAIAGQGVVLLDRNAVQRPSVHVIRTALRVHSGS